MKALIITLTAILIAFSIQNSYSQNTSGNTSIIYHDYVPDLFLDSSFDTIKIDLNNDGILDIEFYITNTSTGGYCDTKSLNKNCQFAYFMSSYSTDSLTCKKLYWFASNHEWLGIDCPEKLGLKFTFNNETYYGWLRGIQSWNSTLWLNTLTIDKYAFCTIANYPLLWGKTEITGVEILKNKEKIKVFTNEQGNSIIVQADELIKNIKLLNLSGVEVKNLNPKQTRNVSIDKLGMPGGAYLVKVTLISNKVYTEKIVLP